MSRSKQAFRVGISGSYGGLNLGDEAILSGIVKELSYVGVATQYIVETPDGLLAVYVQNTEPGLRSVEPGTPVHVAFPPESTFVVELTEEEEPA